MKLVTLTLIAIGLGAAAGCREPNPNYDPTAGDDVDGSVDSSPMCTTDDDCPTATAAACDPIEHACFECSTTNLAACEAGEVCGTDHTCQPCTEDEQCASAVCLADGMCAVASRVIFAASDGADTNECGAIDQPCEITRAIMLASAARDVIKLKTGMYETAGSSGLEIRKRVTLAAHDATFVRTPILPNTPPILTIGTDGDVTILGGLITGGPGDGIYCTQGALHLWRTAITLMRGFGINASVCPLDIERVHVEGNDKGGILMGGGAEPVTLTNSFITGNGKPAALNAGVTLVAAAGSVVTYNTIADNTMSTGDHGLSCMAAAGDATIDHNLFYRNDAIGCDQLDNYELMIDPAENTPKFRSLSGTFDYHLTMQTPVGTIRDVFECDAGIDQEGQHRPFMDTCDYGADEYMP